MNTILAALSLLAVAVSADVHGGPLVFGLGPQVQGRLLHHHALRVTVEKGVHPVVHDHLAFAHVVPKLGVDALEHGFSSYKNSAEHKHHAFLTDGLAGHGNVLVDLVGFSDCHDWHATLLTLWHPQVGLHHKGHTFTDDDHDGKFDAVFLHGAGVDGFVDFLKGKVTREHLKLLLEKGLPTHHVTVELLDEFPGLLL